jgi:hypothetical protein
LCVIVGRRAPMAGYSEGLGPMSAHALRAARVRDGGAEAPGARHARRHVREYPVIVFKSNSRVKAPSIFLRAISSVL